MPSSSEPAPGRLAGKVVVCTGGGSGIGRAAVDAFVGEGASVVVLEVDEVKGAALAELGEAVVSIAGDATSSKANRQLVTTALERFGRIDVACTFVGLFDQYTRLGDLPEGDAFGAVFDEVFTLNVKSPLLTAQAAHTALVESRGSLVLTCSTSSFYPGRGGPLYVGSKFALRGIVKQLAHEWAPEVRVNGVAPGGTLATDLRGPASLGMTGRRLADQPGREDELKRRTPLRVALTPADHAALYVLLASDEARGMSGEVLHSDGGMGVR